jgi:cytochrome c oxidase subunit 3
MGIKVMATTIPPQIEEFPSEERHERDNTGNDGWKNLLPADGNLQVADQYSPPPSSSAIWVGIAAIGMSFAAFTSALIVRQGASSDWRHLTLPSVLFISTLVLLLSSVTLEVARPRVAAYMGAGAAAARAVHPLLWLFLTLGLGVLFVVGQYLAWRQLRSEGLYLATNPNSSFFYVLTAMHALHVLGGLAGLLRVIIKLNRFTLRRSTLNAMAYYWHFLGVLWVYLFGLLWLRL